MPTEASLVEMPEAPLNLLVIDNDTPKQTRQEQVNKLLEISSSSWVAKSVLGYTAMLPEDIKAISIDNRWRSGIHMLQSLKQGDGGAKEQRRAVTLSAMTNADHQRVKNSVINSFSSSAAEKSSSSFGLIASSLLEDIEPGNSVDFYKQFCEKYPIRALCQFIGLPEKDWEQFILWGYAMMSPISYAIDSDASELAKNEAMLSSYLRKLFRSKRQNPENDLISELAMASSINGKITEEEALMLVGSFLAGGIETVSFSLSNMLEYLCGNPDVYSALREDRSLAANSVMELMRIVSSVRGSVRVATEDIEYKEIIFPKGCFMFLSIAAANLNESIFPDPHSFRFDRKHNQDSTFGNGIHYCLGANLAKVEMREAILAVLAKYESIELFAKPEYRPSNAGVWGATYLPIKPH